MCVDRVAVYNVQRKQEFCKFNYVLKGRRRMFVSDSNCWQTKCIYLFKLFIVDCHSCFPISYDYFFSICSWSNMLLNALSVSDGCVSDLFIFGKSHTHTKGHIVSFFYSFFFHLLFLFHSTFIHFVCNWNCVSIWIRTLYLLY